MASIFKPPQITQQQLSSTILEYGEIVYNTGKNEFFTGNGTSGGISLFNENVPLSTSQLVNDSGFITAADVPSGSTGKSYTFPLESRTLTCLSEALSADGTIAMQAGDFEYDFYGNARYVNNVVVVPSGAPSGYVDFVYEETGNFIYNPFTTAKFQLTFNPNTENNTLEQIDLLVDHNGNETMIATTRGLGVNQISKYNFNGLRIANNQVISLKNVMNNEFIANTGDKLKLRFTFGYLNFGNAGAQQNATADQKKSFKVSVGAPTYDREYGFFLSINKDFENHNLIDATKYNTNSNSVEGAIKQNIFNFSYLSDVSDTLQQRNLALMLNDTGILGKTYYSTYQYNFHATLNYDTSYYLYDDKFMNNALEKGGRVRGYTLGNSITSYSYGTGFRFCMFDSSNVNFSYMYQVYELFPVFFMKHKIMIYNPNGYSMVYMNGNSETTDIISTTDTGVTEFYFYIDYDNLGVTEYSNNDYHYVLEKVNANGTTTKYVYQKNW